MAGDGGGEMGDYRGHLRLHSQCAAPDHPGFPGIPDVRDVPEDTDVPDFSDIPHDPDFLDILGDVCQCDTPGRLIVWAESAVSLPKSRHNASLSHMWLQTQFSVANLRNCLLHIKRALLAKIKREGCVRMEKSLVAPA